MSIPGPQNAHFLSVANSLKPVLRVTDERPVKAIEVEKDQHAIMGWRSIESEVEVGESKVLNGRDQVIFDFGGHRTGYLSFHISSHQHTVEPADAPARMRIIFGEVLNDVAEDFEDYKGWVSASWLPEEVINIDHLPATIHMPRRQAFRYILVQAISTSPRFGVQISDLVAHGVTSAPEEEVKGLDVDALSTIGGSGLGLKEEEKEMLSRIDEAAILTLRNCTQTVFEDGPRRDRRLWIGDLRLQAQTAYALYPSRPGNISTAAALAKRCLYLFAAMPYNEEGMLAACVYEGPVPLSGGNSIVPMQKRDPLMQGVPSDYDPVDYAMLFSPALLEYVEASSDLETGHDLFPIALKQFAFFFKYLDEDLAYVVPESAPDGGGEGWHFVDWEPTLDKASSEHAIMVHCLGALLSLSKRLSLQEPSLPFGPASRGTSLTEIISQLKAAHRKHYFDSSTGMFCSGSQRQVSWASCAWAVIAGIPESQEEAQKALRGVYASEIAVKGLTPYLHHHLCEAFIVAGLPDLAIKHIIEYWGSMIDAGALTFFEAWDPKNPRASPYGDLHANSFCHAWSCTPSLLLRSLRPMSEQMIVIA